MPTDSQIMKLLQDMLEQSSLERLAQTRAFQESLDKLRTDMRIFNSLTLLVVCVLAGLNLYYRSADGQELRLEHAPQSTAELAP